MVCSVSLKSHQKRAVWVAVLFFTALVYASSRRGDTRDVNDVISMTNTVADARSEGVTGADVVATSETTDEQRYAVIAPVHSLKELEVLRVTWGVFKPCDETAGRRSHGVDLIFMTDVNLPSLDVPGGRCFDDVYQLRPLVPSCYDTYQWGPPYCFFTMMLHRDLDRKYAAVLQMEADSVPVKHDWLLAAVETVLRPTSGEVWIQAAKNAYNHDNFNGNGAYNLRNETFRRFLSEYREWFFTKVSGDTAFDTNMIRFARETGQFDAFTRHLQASRAIRNCDLMSLPKCRSALDPNTWGGATPAAVLVHSHAFKELSAVRHQLLVELLGNESVNLQSK